MFLSTPADIAIYGGAAGGGKSWALLLEPLRHICSNPEFFTVFFRRNAVQVKNPGGLWDESMKLYPHARARPISNTMLWDFPRGGFVKFGHLEHENSVLNWQGAQIPLLCCQEDTLIIMADGSKKALSDVCVNDYVLTLQGGKRVTAVGKRSLKQCVAVMIGSEVQQIHTRNHKILTLTGWKSYDDMFCGFRQPLTSLSRVFRSDRRSFDTCGMRLRFLWQLPGNPFYRLAQRQVFSGLQWGRQFLSENAVYRVQPNQDNYCGSSLCGNQEPLPLPSVHPLSALRKQFLRLTEYMFSLFLLFGGTACACFLLKFRGYLVRYVACFRLYDEPTLLGEDTDPSDVLQLNDAVRQIRKDWPSCDQGTIQKHSLHKLPYVHPYTGEERQAGEDLEQVSLEMVPCGDHWVRDITVADECHYITESGLVNKNCFDELTHFTESQFFYMLSRNRSLCGVRPYVRASTNPDADSWVAKLISWWIDQLTGYPIADRAGKLRWFIRVNDELVWADSREALLEKYGAKVKPKSLTFIPALLQDNKKLMEADPDYEANLLALDSVQRERLLGGNWKIRQTFGKMFEEKWLKYLDVRPATLNVYIMVDPASSKKKKSDNTAMAVIGVDIARNKYLLDGFNHKMNLRERWLAMRALRRKWRGAPGIQGVFVGYERYGMQSDMEYFTEQMELDQDCFEIKELNWSQNSDQSKNDRVQRLVPDMMQGRFYLPLKAEGETKNQARMRESGQGFRIFQPVKCRDHEGNLYSLLERHENEVLNFPNPAFPDDLVDAESRIYDMDYNPPVIFEQGLCEPEVE